MAACTRFRPESGSLEKVLLWFWMGEGCFQLKPRNSVDNVTGIRLHVQVLFFSLIQGKGIESKQNSKQKGSE
ncbi:unnamed protein product [Prunus armeniaca]|uniref:Uncharacterized protein n=1 Tax=Prunus armeniaca TaxID=36596 RepID=A0A6J5VLG7_PRUAR|nr:unnamed protein product [Prunus armeniaca]